MNENIHASSIKWGDKGILLLGKSGSGKSNLCLRFILNKKALLVADDRTELVVDSQKISAFCPDRLKGLLEIRGIGIKKVPFCDRAKIDLVVELISDSDSIERLPEPLFWDFKGIKIPLIKIWEGDVSAIEKIIAALCFEDAG